MGGHATHDEREARETFEPGLFTYWGKRDPIALFERYLIDGAIQLEIGAPESKPEERRKQNADILSRIEARVTGEIEQAQQQALKSARDNMPLGESAAEGVYAAAEIDVDDAAAATAVS